MASPVVLYPERPRSAGRERSSPPSRRTGRPSSASSLGRSPAATGAVGGHLSGNGIHLHFSGNGSGSGMNRQTSASAHLVLRNNSGSGLGSFGGLLTDTNIGGLLA
ncbi:unnamed protein product, partial [Polarella glacialis]